MTTTRIRKNFLAKSNRGKSKTIYAVAKLLRKANGEF